MSEQQPGDDRYDQLRQIAEDAVRPLWQLMCLMEIDNHDAQMNAYIDALEPFQKLREALFSGVPQSGDAGAVRPKRVRAGTLMKPFVPAHPYTPCCGNHEAICAWTSPDGVRCVGDRHEMYHITTAPICRPCAQGDHVRCGLDVCTCPCPPDHQPEDEA